MVKSLLIFFILVFTLSTSCSCTFIKERLFKKQHVQTQEQGTQQEEAEPKRKAEPIPVNPSHS